jgi:hypothetical protein
MVIDTSAVLAILQDEPERRAFNEAIEAADSRSLSVASFVEASIVIEARFRGGRRLSPRPVPFVMAPIGTNHGRSERICLTHGGPEAQYRRHLSS